MINELANELTLAEGQSQYDTQCKRVLADKTVLAWILKHTAGEFALMNIPLGKELNQMCNLSEYVVELGIQKGIEQGRLLSLIELTQKKFRKNKTSEEIADFLEEDPAMIRKIYLLIQENPDSDSQEILEKLTENIPA